MAGSNMAPAWRRAFLRELARGGSVALAAETVGIDRSSAYQARRRNAAFAASWERALAAARAGLAVAVSPGANGAGGSGDDGSGCRARPYSESRASEHPLPHAGGESARAVLTARKAPRLRSGECVRASKAGRPCVVRAGPGRWSVAGERAFLAVLAATANVRAAARAAGVSTQAAYRRRRQWPGFAAAWDEAKAEGWERLELLLIHAATTTLDPAAEEDEAEEAGGRAALAARPAMTVDQALALYKLHRASVQGGRAQRYGWRQQEADIEAVRAEILRKVAALEKARGARARGAVSANSA